MGQAAETPATRRGDSLWTLAAIGVLAYIGETMGHELIGHGGVCILSGAHITALAPIWMRCSVQTVPMVAGGPIFNFVAAAVFALVLRARSRPNSLGLFLWLSCCFNLLVACGYLMVGGTTGFGDWGFVFASVRPAWLWRGAAIATGAAGYVFGLRVLGALYSRIAGEAGFAKGVLGRRTLTPGIAAAIVASAAEIAGGRTSPMALVLPIGCTLFVGWSLNAIRKPAHPAAAGDGGLIVPFNFVWVVSALAVAAAFILVVGPVALSGGQPA